MTKTYDFLIVGAGILGLALARELQRRFPAGTIAVLEKESRIGLHASGRNSGVLHSGIYYPEGSLKARICAAGAREMAGFCREHGLPIDPLGKVILPVREGDQAQLDLLARRAVSNGARVAMLDAGQLRELEPEAHTITGRALHAPDTSVVDPGAILDKISRDLQAAGVAVFCNSPVRRADPARKQVAAAGQVYAYGHLFNTAGLHADTIARAFGLADRYTILPFRGSYYDLKEAAGLRINGLIYPVPDLNVPFLGIHFTKNIQGRVLVGPSAIPALGRENYQGLEGLSLPGTGAILYRLLEQYLYNRGGFRGYAHAEIQRIAKSRFTAAARCLVPGLEAGHLAPSKKVGIRAQLVDTQKKELVMDFLVKHNDHSTHILNAVSPAFTCAFSFSRYVLDEYGIG